MAYQDFGNGLKYDPTTGQIQINDETGKEIYSYNPNAVGGPHTNYGGQSLVGMYNPVVFGQMGDKQLQDAYAPLISGQEKYTSGDNSVDPQAAKYWNNMSQGSADSIAFGSAYGAAEKSATPEDMSFFDTLKTMAKQRQGQQQTPQVTPDLNTPQITPPATTGVQQPNNQAIATPENNNPQQPISPVQTSPQQAIGTPENGSPTQATTPDYTGFLQALYTQASPYLSQFMGSSTVTTPVAPTSTTPAASTSSTFNTGAPKTQVTNSYDNSPSFSLGGYNPQSTQLLTGTSGKGSSITSQQQSQGMATGQFGSK